MEEGTCIDVNVNVSRLKGNIHEEESTCASRYTFSVTNVSEFRVQQISPFSCLIR